MSDELSPEILALIGEIALETSKLDLAVVELVAVYEGWGGEEVRSALAGLGGADRALRQLVDRHDLAELHRLRREVWSVRDRRNILMHSIVMHEHDEAGADHVWWWHPKTDGEAEVTLAALEEHLFDVQRCFGRVVRMITELRAGRARCVPDGAGNHGESRANTGPAPA